MHYFKKVFIAILIFNFFQAHSVSYFNEEDFRIAQHNARPYPGAAKVFKVSPICLTTMGSAMIYQYTEGDQKGKFFGITSAHLFNELYFKNSGDLFIEDCINLFLGINFNNKWLSVKVSNVTVPKAYITSLTQIKQSKENSKINARNDIALLSLEFIIDEIIPGILPFKFHTSEQRQQILNDYKGKPFEVDFYTTNMPFITNSLEFKDSNVPQKTNSKVHLKNSMFITSYAESDLILLRLDFSKFGAKKFCVYECINTQGIQTTLKGDSGGNVIDPSSNVPLAICNGVSMYITKILDIAIDNFTNEYPKKQFLTVRQAINQILGNDLKDFANIISIKNGRLDHYSELEEKLDCFEFAQVTLQTKSTSSFKVLYTPFHIHESFIKDFIANIPQTIVVSQEKSEAVLTQEMNKSNKLMLNHKYTMTTYTSQ